MWTATLTATSDVAVMSAVAGYTDWRAYKTIVVSVIGGGRLILWGIKLHWWRVNA